MSEKTIMDVSRWQGSIDWDKVKASGKIDGVLMVDCCMRGCGADLRPKGDVEDGN